MPLSDIMYFAGILDGEGCFNIGYCRGTFIPNIIVVNTNKILMNWIEKRFGGNIFRRVLKTHPTWKPMYSWRISHNKALELAETVLPFLHLKKTQACYFSVWKDIREMYNQRDPERREFYKIITSRIKKLNHKGVYNASNKKRQEDNEIYV